jgi:signal transduction histidine kinase
MKLNLRLSQMGLILLGIPAVFEIVFVVVLLVLLHQHDEELRQETRSRSVISHAHNLVEKITNGAIAIGAFSYSRSPIAKQAYEAAVNGMHEELKTLAALLKTDNKQMGRLKAVNNTADEAFKLIEETRKEVENVSALSLLGGNTKMSDKLDKLSGFVGTLQRQIDDLIHAEELAHRDLPAKRNRSRQQLILTLVGGTLLNIGLVIVLAQLFSRTVSRRHLVLMDNTDRLSKAQPLHPVLEGDDEIAQLDRVFHRMVKELAEADQFKKQMVQMASHELRTPLTSVDAILTFLEAGGTGELPEAAKSRLRIAGAEISRLIGLINDLLDIERMEAGKFEMTLRETDLNRTVERAVASVSGALERNKLELKVARLLYLCGLMKIALFKLLSTSCPMP